MASFNFGNLMTTQPQANNGYINNPGVYAQAGGGPALWNEDTSYRQQSGVDLVNALRNAYQPVLEQQNKSLANLYRRRGMENSGLYANALATLGGEQTRALDSQALNVAQFLAQQAENSRNRSYNQHMSILGAKDLAPQQNEGEQWAGALGGLAANYFMPGSGSLVNSMTRRQTQGTTASDYGVG